MVIASYNLHIAKNVSEIGVAVYGKRTMILKARVRACREKLEEVCHYDTAIILCI